MSNLHYFSALQTLKYVKVDKKEKKMYQIYSASMEDFSNIKQYDTHISLEELKNSIQLKRVYVAYDNQNFAGWLRYNLFWDNTPFMNMLYLLEENRGRGMGRRLVEFWEEQMKLQSYTYVMTSTSSDEYAQHFYHRLGYSTIGGFMFMEEPYEIMLSKKI